MSQKIRRRQCGCVNDCFGTDVKPRTEEIAATIPQQRACCEQCEDNEAPCVYEVLSACEFTIRYPGDAPGYRRVVMPEVLQLRKYCITGCEYRAGRGFEQNTSDRAMIPGDEFYFPIPADQVGDYGFDFAQIRFPLLCTINERYWYPEELSSLNPQLLREDYDKLVDYSTTWILRPIPDSGGYWELVYVAPDNVPLDISYSVSSAAETVLDEFPLNVGRGIRYTSVNVWKCFEANNLQIDEETATRYPGLPKYLCVRPRAESVAHLCDTTESQCACCDNGMCKGYSIIQIDCPDGLYEFPPFETRRYLPTDRLTAVDELFTTGDPFSECLTGQPPVPAEIEELVPDVDTVPCGIFYGTYAGGGIVWWCTGTEYNVIIWCIDPITEEAIVVYNGAPSEFTCRCDWYLFKVYFETPPECLQCPASETIETECCPDGVSRNLDVEIAAWADGGAFQPGCDACLGSDSYPPPISGTTIPISYDDGLGYWVGSTTVCGATLEVRVECRDLGGGIYDYYIIFYVNGSMITDASLSSGCTFSCSPFNGCTSGVSFFYSLSDCQSIIAVVTEAS